MNVIFTVCVLGLVAASGESSAAGAIWSDHLVVCVVSRSEERRRYSSASKLDWIGSLCVCGGGFDLMGG